MAPVADLVTLPLAVFGLHTNFGLIGVKWGKSTRFFYRVFFLRKVEEITAENKSSPASAVTLSKGMEGLGGTLQQGNVICLFCFQCTVPMQQVVSQHPN